VVFQQPTLFAGTIKENIIYGKSKSFGSKEIESAGQIAHCHDFITKNLPQQYDTDVGGSGNERLSGGQKQRIAIARAIVASPSVLIFDEATAALDSQSERLVQEALQSASTSTTTIAIAHRLSTIRHAHQICVLRGGKIHETGTHDQLVEQKGLYYNLLQASALEGVESQEAAQVVEGAESVAEGQPAHDIGEGKKSENPNASDEEVVEKKLTPEEKKQLSSLKSALWKKSREEWLFILTGCVGAVAMGLVMPSFAFILSEMLKAFFDPDVQKATRTWAFVYFGLAVYQLIASFAAHSSFAIVGERLTLKLRVDMFRAIVRQDIAWFDEPINAPGLLNVKLSNDCEAVRGLTVGSTATTVQTLTMFIAGLSIAYYYSWQMASIMLCAAPLLALAGLAQFAFISGGKDKAAFEFAGNIANEAVGSIRTVASLSAERHIIENFETKLGPVLANARKKAFGAGISFGFSQFVLFAVYGAAFYFGAWLVKENYIAQPLDMFKVFFAITMSMMGVGQVMEMAPDGAKATIAAKAVFHFLESKPTLDVSTKQVD
jgi:ATP-binding cassette subfamily B (MDR/TAP) protein 1